MLKRFSIQMKINSVIEWTSKILGHDETCLLRVAVSFSQEALFLFSLGCMFSVRFDKSMDVGVCFYLEVEGDRKLGWNLPTPVWHKYLSLRIGWVPGGDGPLTLTSSLFGPAALSGNTSTACPGVQPLTQSRDLWSTPPELLLHSWGKLHLQDL